MRAFALVTNGRAETLALTFVGRIDRSVSGQCCLHSHSLIGPRQSPHSQLVRFVKTPALRRPTAATGPGVSLLWALESKAIVRQRGSSNSRFRRGCSSIARRRRSTGWCSTSPSTMVRCTRPSPQSAYARVMRPQRSRLRCKALASDAAPPNESDRSQNCAAASEPENIELALEALEYQLPSC